MKKRIALMISIVVLACLCITTFVGCQSIYVIDSIVIDSSPDSVHYSVGDSVDLTGLQVTVNYANGNTGSVSDVSDLSISTTSQDGVTTSGAKLTSAGPNIVTIDYKGFTDSFSVAVLGEADIYVDTNTGDDSFAGDSQLTAYKTINTAIANASAGDTICLVAGEHTVSSLTSNITINKSLTFIGTKDNASKLIMDASSIQINADDVVMAGLDIEFTSNIAGYKNYITVNGDNFLMYSNTISVTNASDDAVDYNVIKLGDGDTTIMHNSFNVETVDNIIVMDTSTTSKNYSITYNEFSGNASAIAMGLANYNIDNNTFDLTVASTNAVVDIVIGEERYAGDASAYASTFNSNTINSAYSVLKYSASVQDAVIYGNFIPEIKSNRVNNGTRNFVLMQVQNISVGLVGGGTSGSPIDISDNIYANDARLLNLVLYQYSISNGDTTISSSTTDVSDLEELGISDIPVVKIVEEA